MTFRLLHRLAELLTGQRDLSGSEFQLGHRGEHAADVVVLRRARNLRLVIDNTKGLNHGR